MKLRSKGISASTVSVRGIAMCLTALAAFASPAVAFAQAADLNTLPPYVSSGTLTGSLRILGSPLYDNVEPLLNAFRKLHPEIRYAINTIPNSEGSIAGLYLGVSDLAPAGDDAKITDQMPFYDTFGYLPTEISVASGSMKRGALWPAAFVVNKDNPLTGLTVQQIERIFGAERSGGWETIEGGVDKNMMFTAKYARDASQNIRTWGQLGLKGAWASKPIQTYGYEAPGFKIYLERKLFHWSTKWNPNMKEYIEPKQATKDAAGTAVLTKTALAEMSKDKYAMGWGMPSQIAEYPNLKVLALSSGEGKPFIPLNDNTVANRSYPLVRDAYMYVNKRPGKPLDPNVREFLRFILSRDGQQIISDLKIYNPLPADEIKRQLAKLD